MAQHPIQSGVLEVFCGPMKSGKTREIINRVDKIDFLEDHEYAFFKPEVDTRNEHVESRFGDLKVLCERIPQDKPGQILERVNGESIVAIDEAQFFTQSLVNTVKALLHDGRNVVVAGLDLDFKGEGFGPMPTLLCLADRVTKLTAICDHPGCSELGSRTQRLIDGAPAPRTTPTVLIEGDGDETYEARCLQHHFVPD
jgi:thymidine kinase